MEELPIELKAEILSRLPRNVLFRCKPVSKTWYNLLSSPWFVGFRANKWKKDVRFYYVTEILDDENSGHSLHFMSTDKEGRILQEFTNQCNSYPSNSIFFCLLPPINGLICLYSGIPCDDLRPVYDRYDRKPVYICNPVTHQLLTLPEASPHTFCCAIGFGYSPFTEEYKVVRIIFSSSRLHSELATDSSIQIGCEIISIRHDGSSNSLCFSSWRVIDENKCPYPPFGKAVFANGCLHWLIYDECDFSPADKAIISFDLATETFGFFPHPSDYEHYYHSPLKLRDMEATLSLVYHDCFIMQIWILIDYETGMWSKAYNINVEDRIERQFAEFMVDEEILMVPKDCSYRIHCNIETGNVRRVEVFEPPRKPRGFGVHWESYMKH